MILAQAAAQTGGLSQMLVTFVPIIAIVYFLIIRPQAKQQKQHKKMVSDLKIGDRVMTTSGIYGKVVSLKETTMDLDVAQNTTVTFDRAALQSIEGYKAA